MAGCDSSTPLVPQTCRESMLGKCYRRSKHFKILSISIRHVYFLHVLCVAFEAWSSLRRCRRRPRSHTFGFDRELLKGCINTIQTLQKGQASLNTGQVRKGDNPQNFD